MRIEHKAPLSHIADAELLCRCDEVVDEGSSLDDEGYASMLADDVSLSESA